VERRLTFFTGITNRAMASNPAARNLDFRIEIENFKQTNNTPEPWFGDYSFDYVLRFSRSS
jgi:hypothetical protein